MGPPARWINQERWDVDPIVTLPFFPPPLSLFSARKCPSVEMETGMQKQRGCESSCLCTVQCNYLQKLRKLIGRDVG